MKIVILITLVVLCQGKVVIRVQGPDDFGQSVQFSNQDILGNYQFGYDEDHPSGGSFRKEAGDTYGNKIGSYGLRDADGRIRIVNYVADDFGFRADIKTNEPGVGLQDPASTTFNKPNGIVAGSSIPVPLPPVAPVAVSPAIIPISTGNSPFPPVAVAAPLGLAAPPTIVKAPVVPAPPFGLTPDVPTFVRKAPVVPAPPPASYAVPTLPVASTVARIPGPIVKYPAPAIQYTVPVSASYTSIGPIAGYGKIPNLVATPGKTEVTAPVAASFAVSRYTIPVRYGYSGSPPLPAYQVLQY